MVSSPTTTPTTRCSSAWCAPGRCRRTGMRRTWKSVWAWASRHRARTLRAPRKLPPMRPPVCSTPPAVTAPRSVLRRRRRCGPAPKISRREQRKRGMEMTRSSPAPPQSSKQRARPPGRSVTRHRRRPRTIPPARRLRKARARLRTARMLMPMHWRKTPRRCAHRMRMGSTTPTSPRHSPYPYVKEHTGRGG